MTLCTFSFPFGLFPYHFPGFPFTPSKIKKEFWLARHDFLLYLDTQKNFKFFLTDIFMILNIYVEIISIGDL